MKVVFLTQDFIIEPLGLMYLSACLRQKGHQVKVLKVDFPGYDLNALSAEKVHRREVVERKEVIRRLKEFSPGLLGYSVTTGMQRYYLELNREIKKSLSVLTIWGGPHPTFFPELIEEDGVDIICRGEGEETVVELAARLEAGQDYANIRNLWMKGNKGVFKNELRPFKNDLDAISYPDRELFYDLFPSLKSNPIKNFMASRGCPYDCSYCFNHVYRKLYGQNGVRVRYRSPDNIIEEIKSVKANYPLKIVYFQDDTFNLNRKWLEELLGSYSQEIGLPFHAHLRPDLIDEKLIRLLAASNCLSVTLAFETADDTIRRDLLKRKMDKEEMISAARILRKYNINFRIENMVGLPGGSIKSDWETLELNIQARPSIGWASLYQPYPRTRLGEFCQETRLIDYLDMDFIRPSFFQTSILNLKDKNRVENLQKLFSITVEWPSLRFLVRQLIKLPPNRFFNWVYIWWKRYAYRQRLYKVSPSKKGMYPPRVLFICFGGLGDVLMTTPAFRLLKERIAGIHITAVVLAGRGVEDFLSTNPLVDELFVYDPRQYRGFKKTKLLGWMKKKRFVASLTIYPAGKSLFDFLAFWSWIPWRIKHQTIKNDWLDDLLHNVLIFPPPGYHHQDYNSQLAYGLDRIIFSPPRRRKTYLKVNIPPGKLNMEINLTAEDIAFKNNFFQSHGLRKGGLVIGLHPGCYAKQHLKKWPGERFARLADRLYEYYRSRVIIFGTKEEDKELDEIIKAISSPVIKANDLSSRKVAAILKACDLLIANDSGLVHLSQAVGTPLIALYGPSNPLKVGPLNLNSIALKSDRPLSCPGVNRDKRCCSSLLRRNCPHRIEGVVECFYHLTVDEVMAAVEKILGPANK